MDKAALVEGSDALQDGLRLLWKLDAKGVPVSAAFWCPIEDSDIWWLVIASPLVAESDSRAVYKIIQDILRDPSDDHDWRITLSDTAALSPTDPRVTIFTQHMPRGVPPWHMDHGDSCRIGDWLRGAFVYGVSQPDTARGEKRLPLTPAKLRR